MGKAKAKDISCLIMKSLNESQLKLKDLVTLGSDSPYVNKAVFQIISEMKKDANLPPLLDIGTCYLHVVHNAYRKGVIELGQETVDLIIDIYNFFKLSPVRKEEISKIQFDLELDEVSFLKHVESRWLTLVPAVKRVISQWSSLKKYFIAELPKRDKTLSRNVRYKRIMKCLKDYPQKTLAQLHFLVYSSKPFEKFLLRFQKEEPLNHLLYEEMCCLVKTCLGRFMKTSELNKKSFENLISIKFPNPQIELTNSELEVGSETRKVLDELDPSSQTVLLYSMRKFYHKTTENIISKLPFKNPVIKNCSCLSIKNRCEPWSSKSIEILAESITLIPPVNIDLISDEWKILQSENIPDDWCFEKKEKDKEHEQLSSEDENPVESELPRKVLVRIDKYRGKIFSLKNAFGESKFPELTRLVKAILILPHGNADVERGFSQTSNYLTSKRSLLSAASVSGLQFTKDGLRQFNNMSHKVPITRDFINKGHSAYRSYINRIEDEKRIKAEKRKKRAEQREIQEKENKELEEKKRILEKKSLKAKEAIGLEKTLGTREYEVKEDLKNFTGMMDEANTRIKKALQSNDIKAAKIGQTILEAAFKKVEGSKSCLDKIRLQQKTVDSKKRTLLNYFSQSTEAKKSKRQ